MLELREDKSGARAVAGRLLIVDLLDGCASTVTIPATSSPSTLLDSPRGRSTNEPFGWLPKNPRRDLVSGTCKRTADCLSPVAIQIHT